MATLDSMLLSSRNPEQLRNWYIKAFNPKQSQEGSYAVLNFGGFYVFIDSRDDVGAKNPEPGRMILNFDVDDAHTTVAHLDTLGTTWLEPLENRDGNFFATAIDPDGNYVQIIQLTPEMRAQVEEAKEKAAQK